MSYQNTTAKLVVTLKKICTDCTSLPVMYYPILEPLWKIVK